MNDKLKITTKKNIVMSLIHVTEKNREEKNWSLLGSGTGPGTGSLIPEADPRIRIRIRIEMKRIRNTDLSQYFLITFTKENFQRKRRKHYQVMKSRKNFKINNSRTESS